MNNIITLQESNCRSCNHCIRQCPTKAIAFHNGKPQIITNECLHCGQCYVICPHDAKAVHTDLQKLITALKDQQQVIISLAPSFVEVFPDLAALQEASTKIGIFKIEETAVAAGLVSQQLSNHLKHHLHPNLISTCCPVVVQLVQTRYPSLIDQLAPIYSPMVAHGKLLKEQYPEAKVFFASPCIAKIHEAAQTEHQSYLDGVISLTQLQELINPYLPTNLPWPSIEQAIARSYPITGGILYTIDRTNIQYDFISAEGIDRINTVLKSIMDGYLTNAFLELNACTGSCLGGPLLKQYQNMEWHSQQLIRKNAKSSKLTALHQPNLHKHYEPSPLIKSTFSHQQICDVLKTLGKFTKKDELNCGACGYPTCQEKAIGILEEKADPTLCLPYALSQAQSKANIIFEHTPNGIIVFDQQGLIVEANPQAVSFIGQQLFNSHILEVLPSQPLSDLLEHPQPVSYYDYEYDQYQLVLHHALINLPQHSLNIIILMDITATAQHQQQIRQYRQQTMQVTQQVIEEQMRTVQEIALLLGETTAKSKIALTKLKRSVEEDI
jgi:iron only hydrogenase large subunit-like protein